MKRILASLGPAIVVAAVVLGPGSILTSSKVGASIGLAALPIVIAATVLMIGMVALSARLGVVYSNSICDELSARLGRWVAIIVGLTLFTLVALFQSSNNVALIGGLEPMFGNAALSFGYRAGLLIAVNALIIASLYLMRNLYSSVESLMKILIGLMTLAFLFNFAAVFLGEPSVRAEQKDVEKDWLALLGMIGTTFSVGGAFYQAYLVKEKGWTLANARQGLIDSVVSISVLGLITAMILLTSYRVFYGSNTEFADVGDVAVQLEPLFGKTAKLIFCGGILAGALSSFLVNALIGGTVMSDAIGKGAKLSDGWPLHFTTVALLVGLAVAIASLASEGSTVTLITIAQACTVVGLPALAAALVYLGTRKDLAGPRKIPRWILNLAIIGLVVACGLACLTVQKIYAKVTAPEKPAIHQGDNAKQAPLPVNETQTQKADSGAPETSPAK